MARQNHPWDLEWVVKCLQEAGGSEAEASHLYGRTILIPQLRNLVKTKSLFELDEGGGGSLVFVSYSEKQWEWEEALEDLQQSNGTSALSKSLKLRPTLVNLGYVEGMKYTLGSKFTSREENGDFIFLRLTDPRGDKPCDQENYFELESKDGFFWLRSLVEDHDSRGIMVVLVNGTPIRPKHMEEPMTTSSSSSLPVPYWKLAFGDVITITRLGRGGFQGEPCDLIFIPCSETSEVSKTRRCGDTSRGRTNALENSEIVSKLLSLLPTALVKKARLVSPIWNDEGLKLIRPSVSLSIFKGINNEEAGKLVNGPIAQYVVPDTFLSEISALTQSPMIARYSMHFPRLCVTMPHLGEVHRSFRQNPAVSAMMEDKLLGDLLWFISSEHQKKGPVTTLRLHGCIGLNLFELHELQGFGDVISKLAPTLATLTLSVTPDSKSDSMPTRMRDADAVVRNASLHEGFLKTPLPQLKTVSITIGSISFLPIVLDVLKSSMSPNMENLRLVHSSEYHHFSEMAITVLLGAISFTNFNNLKELAIGHFAPRHPVLTQLPPTLKTLKLMGICLGDNDPESVMMVLEQVKETLEELVLHYPDQDNYIPLHFKFPYQMRKLRSLTILANYPVVKMRDLKLERFDDLPQEVDFRFGPAHSAVHRNRVGDYTTHFPALRSLTVWPVDLIYTDEQSLDPLRNPEAASWKAFLPLLEGFISSSQQVTSVVKLDIPFLLRGRRYHSALGNLEVTFPNVAFPLELQVARGMEHSIVRSALLIP